MWLNLVPATVFFRGQVASVQARNAGGVKLADGMFVLCALVDTSGYSTAVQQKYQGYFITEVALDINGQIAEGRELTALALSRATSFWSWIWARTTCSRPAAPTIQS